VAEDEPDVRQTFVALLERMGYCVVCAAENGLELLHQCREVRADVVFVDLDMPVMDGLMAAQEVSALGMPVVLISGHPDVSHVVVEQEPVVAAITKPASLDAVRWAIQVALDHKPQARQQNVPPGQSPTVP
jgi:response regulator NasT